MSQVPADWRELTQYSGPEHVLLFGRVRCYSAVNNYEHLSSQIRRSIPVSTESIHTELVFVLEKTRKNKKKHSFWPFLWFGHQVFCKISLEEV